MIIHISHGANPDKWFIVEPLEGHPRESVAGTPITHAMAVQSLLDAGRTVYELDVEPRLGSIVKLPGSSADLNEVMRDTQEEGWSKLSRDQH